MESRAADFRGKAREVLRGRWMLAVVAGLIAAFLGAPEGVNSGIEFSANTAEGFCMNFNLAGWSVYSKSFFEMDAHPYMMAGALYVVVLALIFSVFFYILGRIVEVGYMRFHLDLYDGTEPQVQTLFGQFSNWKTIIITNILKSLYEFVGMLFLIIPGIIIGYNYAMTDYILVEHPDLTASEAMSRSKEMMYGNRLRLFCMEISFIGWILLCIPTFGIGDLWLRPYMTAAKTAFYREISGKADTEPIVDGFAEMFEG